MLNSREFLNIALYFQNNSQNIIVIKPVCDTHTEI